MRKISCFCVVALIAFSCVPPSKFKALQKVNVNCEQERDDLKAANEKLTVDNTELNARLLRADKQLAKAGEDTVRWQDEVTRLSRENMMLSRDYNDLQQAQQALAKGSETEIKRLMNELQASQKDLQQREADLNKLSADVNARKTELDRVQKELDQRNQRLTELEKGLEEQQASVAELRKKVSDALLGFENQGLTVTQKNGKVYVSLEEKLLFKSGSTVVDPKGITALKKLAGVLEQNQDINVMIEGHTDDVPVIAGSNYKDNWDLSVLRATSIVRILLDGTGINPKRLTTAGRSQYLPVDPAKTAEARQKNRRTEIILSPNLEELYKLVE
ncbi:MAG TPA: OmpA family protein [Bacteroidales bacterium]|nr:OmpA family protein [Bacteroidales bacterium]